MIFLIEYDPPRGKLVSLRSFEDRERAEAEQARLKLELALHSRGIEHEVVLLQAATQTALRQTHRRYFDDFGDQILNQLKSSTSTSMS